jgi:hypothetical protein
MTPGGVLVHHIAGRTRFRVPEKLGDSGYFANVTEQLGQCPGVSSVIVSELTGSVLVLHEATEPDVLIAYARTFELFDLPAAPVRAASAGRPPAELITHGLGQLDQWIRAQTGRSTDLRSLALTGLIGAAVWQTLRGQLLPAAGTLIWYALTVATNDPRRPSDQDTDGAAAHERADSAVTNPRLRTD